MDQGISARDRIFQSGALQAPHPYTGAAGANQVHLRVLETTDLHGHVCPHDYYSDRPMAGFGLARTATLIRAARAEAANALLVDNGDVLQGSPMGDYAAELHRGGGAGVHPVIRAMNVLGYDAATLGNHDFNYGLDFLLETLAGAAFPVVAANAVRGALAGEVRADSTLLKPYVILDRTVVDGTGALHRLRVGLIGLLPPQIVTWDRQHLEGRISARDIVDAAAAWVPEMKEAGADIVIALNHSGIGAAEHREGMENASVPLARVPGIDALMTGHSHLVFPGPRFAGLPGVDHQRGTIHGKPAVMAGFWGSHLGVVDLMLEIEGGTWRVLRHEVEARPVAGGGQNEETGSDPVVLETVADAHDATLRFIRRPVGQTAVPLHSYFALVSESRAVSLVAEAQRRFVERALQGTPHAGLPVLSAAAPFKAGGRAGPENFTDIPAGPLMLRNVADLYLYPNTVQAVRLTGAEVRDWLERAAGIFNRITPGAADARLLNPEFPSYEFDMIWGLSYGIDLSQPARFDAKGNLADPAAHRIPDLRFDGRPLDPDAEFIVATNSYRANGGGNFPNLSATTTVFESDDTIREVILGHLAEAGGIGPSGQRCWSFAPLADTTVVFDTGPGATAYLDAVEGMAVEPLGEQPDGFLRCRIRL